MRVDLPAGPLDDTLTALGELYGLTVVAPDDLTAGKASPGASGALNAEQALRTVLSETGLVAVAVGDYEYVVRQRTTAERQIDEIIVVGGRYGVQVSTALRTEAALLDTPAAVQIVPETLIDDQAAFTLDEALRNVSGVNFVVGGEGAQLFTRGFGAQLLRDGFLRTEFTTGEINAADLNTENLARIEVLKGPASVLYGRSNVGGTVNLITKRPTDEAFAEFGVNIGSFQQRRTTIDVSGPVLRDQGVGARFVGSYEDSGSFRDQVDREVILAAPSVAWDLSPDTSITLAAEYARIRQTPDSGLLIGDDGEPLDGLARTDFLGEPTDVQEDERIQLFLTADHSVNDVWRVRARATYATTDNLLQVTAPEVLLDDGVSAERFFTNAEFDFDDFRLQTQASANFSLFNRPNEVLFGIDFAYRETTSIFGGALASPINVFDPVYGNTQRFDFEGQPIDGLAFAFQQELERDSGGAFVQHRIDLTDRLILVSGARVDYVRQRASQGDAGDFDELVLEPQPDANDEGSSPRVGLVYKPIDQLSVFGQWTRSFQPPNGVPINAQGGVIPPERGRLFEVGVKVDFAKVNATLAGFRIDRDDVAVFDVLTGGFLAAGEQQSQGLEFDLRGEFVPGWNTNLAYAYVDAQISEDSFLEAGTRLQDIPRHSFNVWSVYEMQAGPLRGFGFGGGVQYVGERPATPENTFFLPDYFRVDATAFYRWNERLTFRLNARNLTNEPVLLNAGNEFTINPGAPRSVIGSVVGRF